MLVLIEKYSYSSDKTKIEENELTVNISLLKLNKMILSDHMNLKISDFIKEKVNKDNVNKKHLMLLVIEKYSYSSTPSVKKIILVYYSALILYKI